MPQPVPPIAPQGAGSSLVVGTPASATGAALIAGGAAFLQGRAVAPLVNEVAIVAQGVGADTFVPYVRRAGVQVLRIVAELNRASTPGARATLAVALHDGTGSVAWVAGPGGFPLDGRMDGAKPLLATDALRPDYPRIEGYLDVSGLTAGTLAVLKVTAAAHSGSPLGIYSLSVSEVPPPSLDPVSAPTTEPGVDAAWTQGGNAIVDGSSGSPRGMGRILRALDDARVRCPWHWQISSHSAGPSVKLGLFALASRFRARARRVRAASSPNKLLFGAVYKFAPTYPDLTDCYLRMTATGVGGGSTIVTNLPLVDTSGAWSAHTAMGEWPCDGTNQEVELTFEASTESTDGVSTATDTLNLATLFVLESEV